MVDKKKMSRIFQRFTSLSKTVEDNESDGQEEVTASTRPICTTDAPRDETTKRPRRHSSNSSQDELKKKSRMESPSNIVEEEEESNFSDEEDLLMSSQMPPNGYKLSCVISDIPHRS